MLLGIEKQPLYLAETSIAKVLEPKQKTEVNQPSRKKWQKDFIAYLPHAKTFTRLLEVRLSPATNFPQLLVVHYLELVVKLLLAGLDKETEQQFMLL